MLERIAVNHTVVLNYGKFMVSKQNNISDEQCYVENLSHVRQLPATVNTREGPPVLNLERTKSKVDVGDDESGL